MNDFMMKLIEYGVKMRLYPSETKNMIRVCFYTTTDTKDVKCIREFWMGVENNDMVSNNSVLKALNEELTSFLQFFNLQRGN
jgi:hypothetical protein